jgi:hypothetical protein
VIFRCIPLFGVELTVTVTKFTVRCCLLFLHCQNNKTIMLRETFLFASFALSALAKGPSNLLEKDHHVVLAKDPDNYAFGGPPFPIGSLGFEQNNRRLQRLSGRSMSCVALCCRGGSNTGRDIVGDNIDEDNEVRQ